MYESSIKEVWAAVQAERAEADYEVYDLSPIRCLIGDSGPRFCRMLAAEDAAAMGQRMNGMEADLAMLDKKLKRLYGPRAGAPLPGGGEWSCCPAERISISHRALQQRL